MFKRLIVQFCIAFFAVSCASSGLDITSPSGVLSLELSDKGGELSYRLLRGDEILVDSSSIVIIEGAKVEITSSKSSKHNSVWKPVVGQFSQIEDSHTQSTLNLLVGGREATLYARLFDDGVGFRFVLEEYSCDEGARFYCDYNLAEGDKLYYTAGERAPVGPVALDELPEAFTLQSNGVVNLPLYVERDEQTTLAVLESDLYSASGFDLMKNRFDEQKGRLYGVNKFDLGEETLSNGALVTPWRVILVGTPAELITSTVILNLAAPTPEGKFDWVKPGKTLWDWRVHGYIAPDGFRYGVSTESYMRFIDFAAENGVEYFLIDDEWYDSVSPLHFELSKELDLARIIEYAKQKGVEMLLYYDRKKGSYGDNELFSYYRSLDMVGIKYGFMGNDAAFTRGAIRRSAENNLMVNFHDNPVPMAGVERTSPNAITREYCHAQQDSRRAFTPEGFIKMAMINSLQGALDMNNGNFDIEGINSGIREKSPRITNSYHSTVVSEVARTLIIYTGLLCIPDAPEAYQAKCDLFEFIAKMPIGKWDSSRVLSAKMGEHITTLRRAGDDWFIGSVVDSKGGSVEIELDFLCEGVEYNATIYEDGEDANGATNPGSYAIRQESVKKGDVISALLAPAGGHVVYITKK